MTKCLLWCPAYKRVKLPIVLNKSHSLIWFIERLYFNATINNSSGILSLTTITFAWFDWIHFQDFHINWRQHSFPYIRHLNASHFHIFVKKTRKNCNCVSGIQHSPCILRAGTREVHNKLEKNRRAHLKECFEQLRKQLPFNQEEKKTSNLSILGNACRTVQVI